MGSTYSSVKFVPFKKATNGTFAYINLQVTCQEENSNEVKLDACELGELLTNIEGCIQCINLRQEVVVTPLETV